MAQDTSKHTYPNLLGTIQSAPDVAGQSTVLRLVQTWESGELTRGKLDLLLLELVLANPELRTQFETIPSALRSLIQAVIHGTTSAVNLPTPLRLRTAVQTCPDILEGDGKPMKCIPNAPFVNWGQTVRNTPSSTYIPRTKKGVCNLVQWATHNGKKVRVSGYRHTWGDLYSADGEILISLLPLDVVETIPAPEPGMDPFDELQGIKIVGTIQENGVTKGLCRIGSATTNEQFRRWCLDMSSSGGQWNWTVPLNVIMVEITWGGSNGPICHGAGWRNETLSDLVTEIEFVNPNGELQTVSDPQQLKAAAGCFGLLGIVTSITLKVDPMTFANMRPSKARVALGVPPPPNYVVPSQVDMSGVTPEELATAAQDFINRCENDYYSEWFWFPYQSQVWINTWKNDGLRADAKNYPSDLDSLLQWFEEWIAECINNWSWFQALPGAVQSALLGASAMSQMPDIQPTDPAIVAPLIDALHFRRGIQNMRVLDMEMEIPIPPRADDPTKPDWSVCQRAWWDAITAVYQRIADGPMRIALEMRIMGGSSITMAPQYGNQFGTCSIEVLTNLNVTDAEWLSFMQQVSDCWCSYTDPAGKPLNVRPHWAKQWAGLTIQQMPVLNYLTGVAYKDRIPEFRAGLNAVAQAGGYTVADLDARFSNALLNTIFGPL